MRSRPFVFVYCVIETVTLIAAGHALCADPPRGAGPRLSDHVGALAIVSLHPSCIVGGGEVLISDIARVDTQDSILKGRIESLDVTDAPAKGQSTLVSPKLVELRLRLAGIDLRGVSIRGSHTAVLGRGASSQDRANGWPGLDRREASVAAIPGLREAAPAPATPRSLELSTPGSSELFNKRTSRRLNAEWDGEDKPLEEVVVAVAKNAVLDLLPWSEDDVSFKLAQPIIREVKLAESSGKYTCTAQLRSPGSPVGRVNVDVTVKYAGQPAFELPVAFDVRHFDNVVATARPIARGRTIRQEDLYQHRWDVTGATDYFTQPDQLIGRVVGRTMTALQILREQDLERGALNSTGKEGPIVIKRQDRVNLIAKIGDLSVTVRGEAMQEGRVGETIRVQNVESKTVIQGRVLSAEEVQIAY